MGLPGLHGPLFKGLLAGYHDVYGELEPTAALALLARLQLPADTPHLAELRSVLAAGHRNHHRSPHAWDDAVRASTDCVLVIGDGRPSRCAWMSPGYA
ncbi:hypothetical protein ACH4YO_32240 [Streptomyces noursei]|uniref:hypothetical protein n=1 Tax=Streptomyces noursei TaxID=1971 RepID=UPI0033FC34F9